MEKVKVLSYEEKPVYEHFREILLQGLKAIGQKDDGLLDFGLAENGDFERNPAQKVLLSKFMSSFIAFGWVRVSDVGSRCHNLIQ